LHRLPQRLTQTLIGKLIRKPLRLAALGAALSLLAGCHRQEAPSADVWASVNGREIHRDEVEKYYRGVASQQGQDPSAEEGLLLKLNIVDELINNEILFERARTRAREASDGEVEDKFTELKSPFTEEEFQKQLKDRGISIADQKQALRRQISIQKLINREVMSKIAITDQDITDFFNANPAQFNVAEPQFHLAQILVTPVKDPQIRNRKNSDAVTDSQAQQKAAALLKEINNGADFSQVAMDYSEDPVNAATGGDLGWIPESSLHSPKQDNPDLSRIVLAMRPGGVSQVFRTKEGNYRILKLLGREAAGQRTLSDPQVQQTIRETLRSRKEQLLRAAYIAIARDESRVENYFARQVLEAQGRLPASASGVAPPRGASQPLKPDTK
jgi:peptidyl-prolyl cis-trans isomerase SurA